MKIANFRLCPYLLIMLVAGIISASFYNAYLNIFIGIIAIAIPLFSYQKKFFIYTLLGSIMMILGIISTTVILYVNKPYEIDNVIIIGRVTEDIEYYDNSTTVILDNLNIDSKDKMGKIVITFHNEDIAYNKLITGDIISFKGNLKRYELNPYDSLSIYLYRNRILYNANLSEIINRESGKVKLNERIRAKIKSITLNAIKDNDSAGMAYALLFGDRDDISYETYNNITNAGITHIFAVSGMHIGILAGFVYFVLRAFKATNKINLIITSIILFTYAYICGFLPSINRAVLMSIIVMFGTMIGRRNDILSIISLSAIILLLIMPLSLFDLSFMLSYTAVYGIILLYKPMDRIMKDLHRKIRPLIITSLSTNIALFPILTGYFNKFSLYFLLANLIILPIIAFLYILLLIGTIIGMIIPKLNIFISLSGYILYFIKYVCNIISGLPFAVIPIGALGIFAIFYYISIITVSDYILLKKKYSTKILIISTLGTFTGLIYSFVNVL